MLDYEWANPSSVMLAQPDVVDGSDPSDPTRHHHHSSSILDHYATTQAAFNNMLPPQPHQQQSHGALMFGHSFNNNQVHQVHSLFEPSVFVGGASSYAPHHHHSMLSSLDPTIQGHHHHHGMMLIPKSEVDVVCPPAAVDFAARIGLNLGGRTYFSSEDDFMNRLYRRARPADHHQHGPINVARCQAEGCHADLSQAKHYQRRHKVCDFHSKASNVITNGLTQRFCQQCSRFHLLSEFDNGKRSCRKRLADHNRRRRKTQQQPNQENCSNNNSQQPPEGTRNSSPDNNTTQYPLESASHTSSAVTVAVSPPRMGLDCFRPRQYQATTSSGSSGLLFFSSG